MHKDAEILLESSSYLKPELSKSGIGAANAKCILSGEHFVVHGQPALVMSLNKKISIQAFIEFNKNTNNNSKNISDIEYQIEQRFCGETKNRSTSSLRANSEANYPSSSLRANSEANYPSSSLRAYGEANPGEAQRNPNHLPEHKNNPQTNEPRTPLINHALANAIQAYKIQNIKKIKLIINSQIPQSRGYGSSACVLTALIKALNNACELCLSTDQIFTWVHEMECYQHGKSSGVDPMIAILGGVLFVRPTNPPSLKNARKLNIDINKNKILKNLNFIDTGPSQSSTGECVEHVRKTIKNNNIELSQAGEITNQMRGALEQEDESKFNQTIFSNQELLEKIGVVPDEVRNKIKKLSEQGFVAKISGSGSIRGDSAGIIISCKNKS